MTRDYQSRLISLTYQSLPIDELERRVRADLNPDFLFYTSPDSDWEYFELEKTPLTSFSDPSKVGEFDWFTAVQIDLLRPTVDYLELRAPSQPRFQILSGECFLTAALKARGIMTNWSTLCCTTQNDHPMSAFRRTIAVLGRDENGSALDPNPHPRFLGHDIYLALEDDLERDFRKAIDSEHYD